MEKGLDMHVEHPIRVGSWRVKTGTPLLNLASILSPEWIVFSECPPNYEEFIPVFQAMIVRGADVTRKDSEGRTAWDIGRHLPQRLRAVFSLIDHNQTNEQ